MNTCQETTELPLALFERFKQSPFYSETANSAKRKTEKGYRKFVQGLTDEFRVVSRQATLEPDFNCVFNLIGVKK